MELRVTEKQAYQSQSLNGAASGEGIIFKGGSSCDLPVSRTDSFCSVLLRWLYHYRGALRLQPGDPKGEFSPSKTTESTILVGALVEKEASKKQITFLHFSWCISLD